MGQNTSKVAPKPDDSNKEPIISYLSVLTLTPNNSKAKKTINRIFSDWEDAKEYVINNMKFIDQELYSKYSNEAEIKLKQSGWFEFSNANGFYRGEILKVTEVRAKLFLDDIVNQRSFVFNTKSVSTTKELKYEVMQTKTMIQNMKYVDEIYDLLENIDYKDIMTNNRGYRHIFNGTIYISLTLETN